MRRANISANFLAQLIFRGYNRNRLVPSGCRRIEQLGQAAKRRGQRLQSAGVTTRLKSPPACQAGGQSLGRKREQSARAWLVASAGHSVLRPFVTLLHFRFFSLRPTTDIDFAESRGMKHPAVPLIASQCMHDWQRCGPEPMPCDEEIHFRM